MPTSFQDLGATMKDRLFDLIDKQKKVNASRRAKTEEAPPAPQKQPRKRWIAPDRDAVAKMVLEPDTLSRLDNERARANLNAHAKRDRKPAVPRLSKASRAAAGDGAALQVVGCGVPAIAVYAGNNASFKSHYLRRADGRVERRQKFRF